MSVHTVEASIKFPACKPAHVSVRQEGLSTTAYCKKTSQATSTTNILLPYYYLTKFTATLNPIVLPFILSINNPYSHTVSNTIMLQLLISTFFFNDIVNLILTHQ